MKILGCTNTRTILLVVSQALSLRSECVPEWFSMSADHCSFSLQQPDAILFKPKFPSNGTALDYTLAGHKL